MALKTRQAIVDEVKYEVYSGLPSNDASISDNFVVRKLNNYIAEAAVKSAFGTNNLDGIVEADGIFRLTYTGLPITFDPVDGVYSTPIPAQPVGIPGNRSYVIYAPAMRGGRQSNLFKMISPEQAHRVRSLPKIRKVFVFPENGVLKFIDSFQIMQSYSTVNASVVTGGANDLTAFINLPDEMLVEIKARIVNDCKQMLRLQDTDPLPIPDTPQPR